MNWFRKPEPRPEQPKVWLLRQSTTVDHTEQKLTSRCYSWHKIVAYEKPYSPHREFVIGPLRSEVDADELCQDLNEDIYEGAIDDEEQGADRG